MSIFDVKLPKYEDKIDWGWIVSTVIGIVILVGVTALFMSVMEQKNQQYLARKDVICPSYLSIARSPRDTLIVMRNEPLCNQYVLEHLK